MIRGRRLAVLSLIVSLGGAGVGCGVQTGTESDELMVDKKVAALLKLPCADTLESVYADPGSREGFGDNRRGEIVRCATGAAISTGELQESLDEAGFHGVQVKTSVRLYRIMYRTQRAGRRPDVSSALVVVPDATSEEDNKRGPLIVYGHGTTPYRQDCAVSRADPLTAMYGMDPDRELRTVLALAAQGWPVIAPDYAGFVQGSPVTGYMFAEDEAYSLLDAPRAMKKLLDKFPDQSVFVGHSQGGHAVLSAQAYEKQYKTDGKIVGVVAFAPFWAPARTFGFITWPGSGYTTTDESGAGNFALNTAVEYFYTHAQLIENNGRDILSFNIDDLIGTPGTACNFFPDLSPYGTEGTELFTDGFAEVASCAAIGEACDHPLAQTWSQRFRQDRPALDPKGAPVLLWQGAWDPVVPVTIAGCGVDKIRQDFPDHPSTSASLKVCADPDAEHELVESNNAAHVIQWIRARAHKAEEPTYACGSESLLGLDCLVGNHD